MLAARCDLATLLFIEATLRPALGTTPTVLAMQSARQVGRECCDRRGRYLLRPYPSTLEDEEIDHFGDLLRGAFCGVDAQLSHPGGEVLVR